MRNQATNEDQPELQRDPDEWKTGDEPMTDAQRSYLDTLCRETGEEFDETLQANRRAPCTLAAPRPGMTKTDEDNPSKTRPTHRVLLTAYVETQMTCG